MQLDITLEEKEEDMVNIYTLTDKLHWFNNCIIIDGEYLYTYNM